jgi:hypothetical protein
MTPVHLPAEGLGPGSWVEPAAFGFRSSAQTTLIYFLVVPHANSGAPCQIRTGFSGLQVRRIAGYAYRARNFGANGANRTLIGCLPWNCSPVELHRLGARGGIRNPDLRVTNAVLFHLSYSGANEIGASAENRTPFVRQAIRCPANGPRPQRFWSGRR